MLEDRLRGELRAEAELITPESIVPLRLPSDTERVPGVPRRRGPRQWPPWLIPLAAAAAAAAVIAGTFAVAHILPGGEQGPRPASPEYATVPANYAYKVQGNIYNYKSHGTQYSAGPARCCNGWHRGDGTAWTAVLGMVASPGNWSPGQAPPAAGWSCCIPWTT